MWIPKGLLAAFRQCQIYQHTAVVFALQLIQRHLHLVVRIRQFLIYIILQCHIAVLYFIIQKHNDIDERDRIGRQTIHQLGVVFIIYGIGHIQKLRHLVSI